MSTNPVYEEKRCLVKSRKDILYSTYYFSN